jgi:hypothetical protein
MQIRGGMMTGKEIKRLVSAYFEKNPEEAEDSRADGIGVLRDSEDGEHGDSGLEGLELHLVGMQEELARGELRSIASVTDAILKEACIDLPKDSHEYRKLSREVLKGAIEATKTELARMRGDYSMSSIPFFPPGRKTSRPPAPYGEKNRGGSIFEYQTAKSGSVLE